MNDGPLNGIRVLEATIYLFASAAGAVLADWGADVIKVENVVAGDPARSTAAWGLPAEVGGLNYLWEVSNRGKRGIAVDLSTEPGREILLRLAEDSDVFLTNFRPSARRRLGIDVNDLMARNPKIVYARASATGPRGPEAENAGFDGVTYWARSGAASSAPRDSEDRLPSMPGPAFGDTQSGMALAGGICAALLAREKTHKGIVVDTSLLAAGLWAMQPTIAGESLVNSGTLPVQYHFDSANPINTMYRTSDDRFIMLGMLQADRYWAEFCVAVGRPEWLGDERFVDTEGRSRHRRACIEMLDELFGSRTLAEWQELFSTQEFPWDVARLPGEVKDDRQAVANGYVHEVMHPGGTGIRLIAAPAQFDEFVEPICSAPRHGEHTIEVLRELGTDQTEILDLQNTGIVRQG